MVCFGGEMSNIRCMADGVLICCIQVWKKHFKVDGLVTQHVSPFEQHIVAPLLKELPGKASKKVRDFLIEAGPGLGLGVLIYWYGEKKHKDIAFHHRA